MGYRGTNLALTCIFMSVLVLSFAQYFNGINEQVCRTSSCNASAELLLRNMDESVDPCDNFYEFVCGGFLHNTSVPDDKAEVGVFENLRDLVRKQLRTVFEEPSSWNELKPITWLKKFYSMCLDTQRLEDMAPVRELLKDLGGWPVLEGESWDEENFHWQKSVNSFRRNGLSLSNFITVLLSPDMKNSSQSIIYIDQAELEIWRYNLFGGFSDVVVQAYYDYMVDLAVIFGADRYFAEQEVRDMVIFKIRLANITAPDEERLDKEALYNPMDLSTLQSTYPSINWKEYLTRVLDHPDLRLTHDQKVSVAAPGYLSKLTNLLDNTPKRAQANHAIFQAVRSLEWVLPKAVRDAEQRFKGAVYGTTQRLPRWQECVLKTNEVFHIAAQALYTRKYGNKDVRQSAAEMVSNIQNAFIESLKQAEWMDEITRNRAMEKAKAMSMYVAFRDEFLDDKEIEDYYSGLKVHLDNILRFLMDVSVFIENSVIPLLNKSVNKTDWKGLLPITDVNAIYNPQDNKIYLPLSILQSIVFDENRLRAMNYGVAGFFIGHEITHGFDSIGRKFDKDGNLVSWWTPEVEEVFKKKADCIIQQYSNYTVPQLGLNLNGRVSQGENIADNGGVKQAYLAYNSWVERNGPEPKLPGLNYTGKQLFWISTATVWCTKEKEASLAAYILDSHPLGRFRVIGSLSNSDYFAKDFRCPVGSNMNPVEKCQVW